MYFSYHCEVNDSQALPTVLSGDGQGCEWNCYCQSITVVNYLDQQLTGNCN